MASGCLGLITFPREPGRVTLERIEARWPALIPTLREHPGIGFLLVRSERRRRGRDRRRAACNYLDEEPRRGRGPARARSAPTPRGTSRAPTASPTAPTSSLNSTYWAETDEVAAFEELVGSHGGMGGAQSHPFALFPSEWELPDERRWSAPRRCTATLRRWLADLGHDAYR